MTVTLLLAALAAALILAGVLGRGLVRWGLRAHDDEEAIRYLHDQLTTTSKGYRPPPNTRTASAIHRALIHREIRR